LCLSTGPHWLGEAHLPAKTKFDGFLLPDLGQNEVLCYLSYEVPYFGPEGVKSGRPTQAVGHAKQNVFKFKIV
jgi:hypothetical protein